MGAVEDLLSELRSPDERSTVTSAKITAVGTNTVTLELSPGTDPMPGVPVLFGYTPVVNDVVVVQKTGARLLVLGPTSRFKNAFEPPAATPRLGGLHGPGIGGEPGNDSGVSRVSNLNAYLRAGFYEIAPAGTNAPTADWYQVIHHRHTNGANNYQQQIATNFFSGSMFYRTCFGGDPTLAASWSPWIMLRAAGASPSHGIGQTENGWITIGGSTVINGIVPPGWGTGFSNYPVQYGPVRFRKDPHGFVHFRGLSQGGAADDRVAFTMPAGFRPVEVNLNSILVAQGRINRVNFNPDGTVVMSSGDSVGAAYSTAWQSWNQVTPYLAEL